ncbi:TIGR02391 family protein [Streptomyces goshikiensis]|uniref:TIGR02391 family protein n=1 Tax=Streptomyces goshikiensis TaxID=1942 RepID=UPI0037AC3FAC
MWQSGHFREAVTAAARKVNVETQNKLDRKDVSERRLFQQAFSQDAPKAGQPRLRLMEDDGSDTYRSVHRGAAAFAEGFFAAIRNPNSHADGLPDLPQHEALEQLAALSVLARWVTAAAVVTVWGRRSAQASRSRVSRAASRAVRPTPIRVAEAGPVQSP